MDFETRPLTPEDEPLLWEMLYQALRTAESAPAPDAINKPEYARYVEGWGRAGDTGFVALDEGTSEPLGAVWLRRFDAAPYPHLAFAVKAGHRRRGIGAVLLTQLVKATPQESTIAMQADPHNPAVRLYERFGFRIVEESAGIVVMSRDA